MEVDPPAVAQEAPSREAGPSRRRRPHNRKRQTKQDGFLLRKNLQLEGARFRKEGARFDVPSEYIVPVSKRILPVPITIYGPMVYAKEVLDITRKILPNAPAIDDLTYVWTMRYIYSTKVSISQRNEMPPIGWSSEILDLPMSVIRKWEPRVRGVLNPLCKVIDLIGSFDINGQKYMPFLTETYSDDADHTTLIDGSYQARKSGTRSGVGSKRSRVDLDDDEDPVEEEDRTRTQRFPWPEAVGQNVPPTIVPDEYLTKYFDWSQAMKRYNAVSDTNVLSGVGHPTQIVRTSSFWDDHWNAWSYRDSGVLDFSMSFYGLGEQVRRRKTSLVDCHQSDCAEDATLYAHTRRFDALNAYETTLAYV